MPSAAPGTPCRSASSVEAPLPVRGVDRSDACAVAGVLLDPVDDAPVEVDPVRRRAVEDEQVRGVRVEDELGRHAALAQRGVPLLGLADRAAHVGGAVQHQRRRVDLVDPASGDIAAYRSRAFHGTARRARAR